MWEQGVPPPVPSGYSLAMAAISTHAAPAPTLVSHLRLSAALGGWNVKDGHYMKG